MKRLMTPTLILLAATLVVFAGYFGFNNARGKTTQADADPSAPPTVPVTQGDVLQTVIAPGQLVGVRESVLGMEVGGRLTEVNVRPGDMVRDGDVLVWLDPTPFEAALQEARLKLQQGKAEYEQRRAEAELAVETARLKLEGADAGYEQRLDEAELAIETAQLKLEGAQIEHVWGQTEAELALQISESRLAQVRLRYPALTAAEIRLQNAIEAEAEAEVEYQEALERQRANWEPEEVAEGYRRTLEAARDERKIAQTEYDTARGSQAARSEELKGLEIEVERARIALERLEAGVDPLLALELEKAKKSLADLTKADIDPLLALELEKAKKNLADLAEAGVDPLLELALQKAQADLEAVTLVAPFDGVVLEVCVKPGESVAKGVTLITLVDPSAVEARVTVIEEDLPLVEVGQPVELFFDARPEVNVGGQVARIVPQRVAGEARPLYHVYVALQELPEGLLPGMTVDASIIIAQRMDVLRLPRALVRAGSGGATQVEVWRDGQAHKRKVQVGLRGDLHIEILEGLGEGEQVVGQ